MVEKNDCHVDEFLNDDGGIMNSEMTQQAIRLPQEMLDRFWKKDLGKFLELADDDIIWIGSQKEQFCIGKEAAKLDLEGVIREMSSCHLSQEEFHVAQNIGKSCTIAGRYYVTTDENTDLTLQVQQRCVCTWKEVGDQLRVSLLCVSNPLGELKVAEGERFVNHLGKTAHAFLMKKVRMAEDRKRYSLADTGRVTRFFGEHDLLYAEADGKRTNIHLMNETFTVNMGLSACQQALSKSLLRIHRTILINPEYVQQIRPYEVLLQNGSRLPIPEKRYREVHDELVRLFHS